MISSSSSLTSELVVRQRRRLGVDLADVGSAVFDGQVRYGQDVDIASLVVHDIDALVVGDPGAPRSEDGAPVVAPQEGAIAKVADLTNDGLRGLAIEAQKMSRTIIDCQHFTYALWKQYEWIANHFPRKYGVLVHSSLDILLSNGLFY